MDPIRTLDVPASRAGQLEREGLADQVAGRFSFKKVFRKVEQVVRPVIKAAAPAVAEGVGNAFAPGAGTLLVKPIVTNALAPAPAYAIAGAGLDSPSELRAVERDNRAAAAVAAGQGGGLLGGIPPGLLLVGGAVLVLLLGGRR